MGNIALNPITPTWKVNDNIDFEVTFENSRDCNFLNLVIHRIFELNDLAIGQFILPLKENGNNKYQVALNISNVGVYYISKVVAEKYPKNETNSEIYDMHHPLLFDSFEENEFFSPYFLITDDNANYTTKAIKDYVYKTYQDRHLSLKLGDNEGQNQFTYEVVVLCKDVYLSSDTNFKSCTVKPYIPSTNDDMLKRINNYLETKKWKKFDEKEVRKDILYSPNPQVIFEFPKVFASNKDEVVNLVVNEIEMILGAYSLTRNAIGEILAIAVKNADTNEQYLTFSEMDYVGNIACGDVFGENPFLNNCITDTSKENNFLQLCISLFNQASIEDNIEFAFTKYWSVLETMAESKNYNEKQLHKYNLDGVKLNPLTSKQRPGKKDYVRELIREYKNKDNNHIENILISTTPLTNNKMELLLSVWYYHRNCAVHAGGCIRGVLKGCKDNCNLITKEYIINQKGLDVQQNILLDTIRQTIRQILIIESTKNAENKNLISQYINQNISVVRQRKYIIN
ncbi:hypothetical protein [Flavobacterium sp. Arc2]|jgi:hypothetical protein|uniref:hypothetical protein n=1 Tax=Flavobacterium sp. Arc2 TaxID=3046685 RepID=UPI00352BF740